MVSRRSKKEHYEGSVGVQRLWTLSVFHRNGVRWNTEICVLRDMGCWYAFKAGGWFFDYVPQDIEKMLCVCYLFLTTCLYMVAIFYMAVVKSVIFENNVKLIKGIYGTNG